MANKAVVISVAVAVVASLIVSVSNPNLTEFKAQRAAEDGVTGITCNAVETSNYVVFSRYEYRCLMSTKKYVGILGNYFEIKDDAKQPA